MGHAFRLGGLLLALALGLPSGLHAQASPRPLVGSTLQSTDTSANSLLVGCAIGSTTCAGGIKAGTLTLTDATVAAVLTSANPILRFIETGATANEGVWRLIADGDAFALQTLTDAVASPVNVFGVTRTGTTVDTFSIAATQTAVASGGASGPGLTFSADMNTGLYLIGADNLGVATGGVLRSDWSNDGTLTHAAALKWTAAISPTALSGNVDNYAPTGFSTAYMVRIDTGASARQMTGLAGGVAGRKVALCVIGASALTLMHEDGASTAANRFLGTGAGPSNVSIAQNACQDIIYDGTSARWRVYNP